MKIKVLSKQVINQIAAGEVIRRPASVVKELIENSFDAGASKISVDIEKGGTKLIRIRDDGHGIIKKDLALAIKNYATSKISSINDLEKIKSLGFRGEALASISSISKLSLISRSIKSIQAWQIYSEGRDNLVKIKPAAHPCGTTLEVLNLFYNTPARKKFLCTEKTEFIHIDKLVKNLAISHLETSITLKHNGKLVRQYKSNNNQINQSENHLSIIYGENFIKKFLYIKYEKNNIKLYGWIINPYHIYDKKISYQYELQYFYVNKRAIKNRLIRIAIKRAYQDFKINCEYIRYIIYLDINPCEIDINVHPSKKDVHFNQARLVHDFIYYSIVTSIKNNDQQNKYVCKNINSTKIDDNHYQVISDKNKSNKSITEIKNKNIDSNNKKLYLNINNNKTYVNENKNYKILISNKLNNYNKNYNNLLIVFKKKYALLEHIQGLVLISLPFIFKLFNQLQLNQNTRSIKNKPLIIPIHIKDIKTNINIKMIIKNNQYIFKSIGIDIQYINKHIVIYAISFFCDKNKLPDIIFELLNYISYEKNIIQVINWLLNYDKFKIYDWNIFNTNKLLNKIKNFYPKLLDYPLYGLLKIININELVKFLKKE